YVRRYTDLPFLVRLEKADDGYRPTKFLTADDLGSKGENSAFKTVVLDEITGEPVIPNGSLGFRYGEEGEGRWNLELGDTRPRLSLYEQGNDDTPRGEENSVEVLLARFDSDDAPPSRRGVPAREVGGHLVTTVFVLLLAQYGAGRDGIPGTWPSGYDDPDEPCTPAWQETFTGVPAARAEKIGREVAASAEEPHGRSMGIMGAGRNHWFPADPIYGAFLALTPLPVRPGATGRG